MSIHSFARVKHVKRTQAQADEQTERGRGRQQDMPSLAGDQGSRASGTLDDIARESEEALRAFPRRTVVPSNLNNAEMQALDILRAVFEARWVSGPLVEFSAIAKLQGVRLASHKHGTTIEEELSVALQEIADEDGRKQLEAKTAASENQTPARPDGAADGDGDDENLGRFAREYLAEMNTIRPASTGEEAVAAVVAEMRKVMQERGISVQQVVEQAWADLARKKHELSLRWYRVTVMYQQQIDWGIVYVDKGVEETVVFEYTGKDGWSESALAEAVYPKLVRPNRRPILSSIRFLDIKRYETEAAARAGVGATW